MRVLQEAKRLARRLYGGASEQVQVGDFLLDMEAHSVRVHDRPLDLTREEFDLLLFMLDHRRNVVTPHSTLCTDSDNGVRRSSFLRVLSSLRKKLEADGSSVRYIRTESWVVYSFDPTSAIS